MGWILDVGMGLIGSQPHGKDVPGYGFIHQIESG